MKHALWLLLVSSTLLSANSSKIDEKTGLIWQDNTEVGQKDMDYDTAKTYCSKLKVDGFSDWRLPTIKELYTIVDLTQKRPALKNGFQQSDDGRYWTGTEFAERKDMAWYISMSYGEAEPYKKSRLYAVRCVRTNKTK